jgi:hypothetical protein
MGVTTNSASITQMYQSPITTSSQPPGACKLNS